MRRQDGSPDGLLSTSALARATDVEASTIRFYERRRLLSPTSLRPSGYRQYSRDAVERVRFIREAQTLGLSLQEIADLLALGDVAPPERRQVEQTLTSITARIETLESIRAALRALLAGGQEGVQQPKALLELIGPRRAQR